MAHKGTGTRITAMGRGRSPAASTVGLAFIMEPLVSGFPATEKPTNTVRVISLSNAPADKRRQEN